MATTRRTAGLARPLHVSGDPFESPATVLGGRLHGDRCRLGRSVAAQAPGRGHVAPSQPGQVGLPLRLDSRSARWPPATTFVGTKGPGLSCRPSSSAMRHQVDHGLCGDAAASVLLGHEHGGPSQLGSPSPQVRVERVGVLHDPSHVRPRLVLGQEPPRGRAQTAPAPRRRRNPWPNDSLPAQCAPATRCVRRWPSTRRA